MNKQTTATHLWGLVSKEITGIQLLWTAVERMYFKEPAYQGIASLEQDTPVLYRLMQTALMESLLMRISRLMDPSTSGRGAGVQDNLSLARLMVVDAALSDEVDRLRSAWNASGLRLLRDKYISHNDLTRALAQDHTLNVPLSNGEVEAVRTLTGELRDFRRRSCHKINKATYLDEAVSAPLRHEIQWLNLSLIAGDCFHRLLPDHACLQEALADVEQEQVPGTF